MRIGVDLGGTKIEALALGPGGEELWRRRIATPRADGYLAIVRAVADLVAACEREVGRTGSVGIGTPGSISPTTGLLRNSNTTLLNGHPLDRDLAAGLGRPIQMANDADCLVLSEAVDGAGAGRNVVFGVIVGTGTGGGIAASGRLLVGPNRVTGEWGHNPLPWPRADELPGPPCTCGRRGCIESWLSGPALAADHERHTGEARTGEDLARAVATGDPAARATLERHADRFARALATVVNLLDPDIIVVGGGVSLLPHLYERVPALWGAYVFSDGPPVTPIVPAQHGDSSGVRGAARLWPEP